MKNILRNQYVLAFSTVAVFVGVSYLEKHIGDTQFGVILLGFIGFTVHNVIQYFDLLKVRQKTIPAYKEQVAIKSIRKELLKSVSLLLSNIHIHDTPDLELTWELKNPDSEEAGSKNVLNYWIDHQKSESSIILSSGSGSGKTFSLLMYCKQALESSLCDANYEQMIPIVVDLSEWKNNYNLEAWLAQYVHSQIKGSNKEVIRNLVQKQRFFYLFDALDEVAAKRLPRAKDQLFSYARDNRCVISLCDLDNLEIDLRSEPFERLSPLPLSKTDIVENSKLTMDELNKMHPEMLKTLRNPLEFALFNSLRTDVELNEQGDAENNQELFTESLWSTYLSEIERHLGEKEKDRFHRTIKSLKLIGTQFGNSFGFDLLQPEESHPLVNTAYIIVTRTLFGLVTAIIVGLLSSDIMDSVGAGLCMGLVSSTIEVVQSRRLKYTYRSLGKRAFWLSIQIITLICIVSAQIGLAIPHNNTEDVIQLGNISIAIQDVGLSIMNVSIFILFLIPRELFYSAGTGIRLKTYHTFNKRGLKVGAILGALFFAFWMTLLVVLLQETEMGTSTIVGKVISALKIPYTYALIIGVIFGGIVGGTVGYLGFTRVSSNTSNSKKVQKFSTIIKTNWRRFLKGLLIPSVFIGFIIFLAGSFWSMDVGFKWFRITVAITIFISMWSGGIELMKFYSLRFILSLLGEVPWNMNRVAINGIKNKLLVRRGPNYRFRHSSLLRTIISRNQSSSVVGLKTRRVLLCTLSVTFIVGSLIYLTDNRNTYWSGNQTFSAGVRIAEGYSQSAQVKSYWVAKKDAKYIANILGRIKLGSFMGYSKGNGTSYGFMGVPVDDEFKFNHNNRFNHGAVIFHLPNDSLVSFDKDLNYWPFEHRTVDIGYFCVGDTLKWMVNDNETSNNQGDYIIRVIEEMYFPSVIAHRGGTREFPENTACAVQDAVTHEAEYIEIDVRLTSDEHIVLMHDKTVNRTTDGKGAVHELSLQDINALNIPSEKLSESCSVPTLDTILDLVKGSGSKLLIEVKKPIAKNTSSLLHDLVKMKNMKDEVVIISFCGQFLLDFRTEYGRDYKIGLLAYWPPDAEYSTQFDYLSVFHLSFGLYKKRIRNIRSNGSTKILLWTVNDMRNLKKYMNSEIDGITTDYPTTLMKMLSQQKSSTNKSKECP